MPSRGTATMYSPDGRIPQIENAAKAVTNGSTIIGMRGKDSVVLAADKIIGSSLYEPDCDERILTLEKNIGMAIAGHTPDGHVVAHVVRHEAGKFRQTYSRAIPTYALCMRVCNYMHANTMNAAKRPFGLSAIVSSWDAIEGPQMFMFDPSGSFLGYCACSSGRAKMQAIQEFDKLENISAMETEELVRKAGEIIYKCHSDKWNRNFRFEMGIVGRATGGLHLINPSELTEIARDAGDEATADSSSTDDPLF